jgi:hypothetical protein
MSMDQGNGRLRECPVSYWHETSKKVDEMHTAITEMGQYLPHLQKLEVIAEASKDIKASNSDIKDKLIAPATAVGKVDLVVVMPVIRTLCFMLCSIVIWFTGVQPHLDQIFGFFSK